MVGDLKYALLFYKYGEFAAEVMLAGVVHPDMQRSNIAFDLSGNCKFCDYSDIKMIDMPGDLNKERVRQLTEALFPLINGTENSFLYCSYFRMGFISNGGVLASELFANTMNNGISSALYTGHKFSPKKYDASSLWKRHHNAISEWKKIDIKSVNLEKYRALQEYKDSFIRKNISQENMYYLDQLYFSKVCLLFKDKVELKVPYAVVLYNMSLVSMNCGNSYTEYGLLKKCLKLHSGEKQIEDMCKRRVMSLLSSWNCNTDCVDFIDEVIEKYDLFEFLWILDDIDKFNK